MLTAFAHRYGTLWCLSLFDLQDPVAQPVFSKLRAAPSAMRFTLDNPFRCFADFGLTTAAQGTVIAANVFGRDEQGGEFVSASAVVLPWVASDACSDV